MAFWNKAVESLKQMVKPGQDGQGGQGGKSQQMVSNRANGGFSGYQPKVTKNDPAPRRNAAAQQGQPDFLGMMPDGVVGAGMGAFENVGGQTGNMPPQPGQPVQGTGRQQPVAPQGDWGQSQRFTQQQMNYQPGGNTGYQQPQPGYQQQPVQQPVYHTGYQQPVNYQPPYNNVYQQPQQTPPPAPQPPQVQNDGNVFFMPNSYVSEDGNAFAMVMRVAQITGVSSCFGVIEFMQNQESVIVNAEQITDSLEADRCMDLLFGAAYAMGQTLTRVSAKQIYLITPPNVQVQPYEGLRRMGEEDIDRRWPGVQRQSRVNYAQASGGGYQDDFAAGFGMNGRPAQPNYAGRGGFGMHR